MKKPKIQVTITTNELNEQIKEEMWQLYRDYYHYSREYFIQRIDRNNYFSFYSVNGNLVGFTGLRINRTEICERECLLIYFGQTIIHRAYRGNALIPRTAVKLLVKYWKDLVMGRIYVWADALTYKAYLVFAKTLKEYYPAYRSKAPQHVRELINYVGEEYYGDAFCRNTGTVKKDTVFVNDSSTIIDTEKEKDPDVLFYADSNPDYINGHGLITLAPMTGKNYLYVILKCIKKTLISPKRRNCKLVKAFEPKTSALNNQ